MADPVLGFSERDVARIGAVVRAFESGAFGKLPQLGISPLDRNYARVPFRNDSGETVPAYGVMRLGPMATVDSRAIRTILKPNTSFNRRYLVNGSSDVANGARGWGTWLWHADYVLYDTGNTPAEGESWGPQNGAWTIKKWRYGFTVTVSTLGSGSTSRVFAQQEWVNHVRGKSSGAISKGSTSGTVNVYDGNGSIITSTTLTSVVNRFADVADAKEVDAEWIAGNWSLTAAECA